MLRYIFGISVITLAIIAIRFFAKGKISKRAQYALWLLVPAFMFFSPILSIDIALPAKEVVVNEISVNQESTLPQSSANNDLSELKPIANPDNTEVKPSAKTNINWSNILMNTKRAVTCLFIVAVVIYNAGFILYCRKRRIYENKDASSNLDVYRLNHHSAPFLLGKDIYLSDSVISDETMYKYAICHEYCHYKHGDAIWSLVRFIVLAINWYNPLIWIAFVMAEQDSELACDESVIAMVGEENNVEYGKVLLVLLADKSLGKHDLALSTAMNGRSKKLMKDRIISIKQNNKKGAVPFALVLSLALAISGLSLLRFNQEEKITYIKDSSVEITSEDDTKVTEEITPESTKTEAVKYETVEFTIPPIGELEDGCYVGQITSDVVSESDYQVCYFAPRQYVEVDQDYIDELSVGDVIDLSNTISVDYIENFTISNLEYEQTDEFYLLGTSYSGEIFKLCDNYYYFFARVKDTDSWHLFNGWSNPVFTGYDYIRLVLANDYEVYDGCSPIVFETEEVAGKSIEERKDVMEFRTIVNPFGIETIEDFFKVNYEQSHNSTVIEIKDNQVINIWFWYGA